MTYHTALSHTIANLESNDQTRLVLRNEDLKELQELGQGNGGSVKKVEHVPTGKIMAKKVTGSAQPFSFQPPQKRYQNSDNPFRKDRVH